MQLRNYQSQALSSVIVNFNNEVNKQLLILPTGSGKTVIMAAIAYYYLEENKSKRLLLLAHRDELLTQAYTTIKKFWPEAEIGICKAERDEIDKQIVIGSVQTCSTPKRLEKLKQQGFDILLIDEAHHSVASSYLKIIEGLGFNGDDKEKLLVAVTATPNRLGSKQISDIFEKTVFTRSIGSMIQSGYLCPIRGRKVLTNFSIAKVRTQGGDFKQGELSKAVNTEARNNFIVQKYLEYAEDRKSTLAFCVDISHAQNLAEAFIEAGVNARAIHGQFNPTQRREILNDFSNGKIDVLTSVALLTEGYDEPKIDCILMTRPTKSGSLYIQCVGRGTRLSKGKNDLLVLDFTDEGHTLKSGISLAKSIPEAEIIEDKPDKSEEIKTEIKAERKAGIAREADKEFDILGENRFIWINIGDGEESLLDDNGVEIVITPNNENYIAKVYYKNETKTLIEKPGITRAYAMRLAEDFSLSELSMKYGLINKQDDLWPATENQAKVLKANNLYKPGMSKLRASIALKKAIAIKNKQNRASKMSNAKITDNTITNKQKIFLARYGITTDHLTKIEAINLISKIKSNPNIKA